MISRHTTILVGGAGGKQGLVGKVTVPEELAAGGAKGEEGVGDAGGAEGGLLDVVVGDIDDSRSLPYRKAGDTDTLGEVETRDKPAEVAYSASDGSRLFQTQREACRRRPYDLGVGEKTASKAAAAAVVDLQDG
mmetsp:Transcript_37885/g.60846  ORF Transcript_37885/g.60846 Transcript_37885/m.60846 type:complete len:134 (-) Transcript_37885:1000-1401(-)